MRRVRPTRAPAGATDAYDAFFTAHIGAVYRVGARILGPGPGAEDVAVEAMARAYVHWSAVASMERPVGWVLRVATNLALDDVRRRVPRLSPATSSDRTEEVVLRGALVAALRELPRRQQEVVVLRYIADLPEADVAAALGISTGSVKTHLHRALPRLRAGLAAPA